MLVYLRCNLEKHSRDVLPAMNLFNLIVVFITYSLCDVRSSWAAQKSPKNDKNENLRASPKNDKNENLRASPKNDKNENLRALYNKLKRDPNDNFLDNIDNIKVAEEDLDPQKMSSSDDLKIMLYKQGYLELEKHGALCMLRFRNVQKFQLYSDLVFTIQQRDKTCKQALLSIQSYLDRMPPKADNFESLMLALDTILCSVPRIFDEWQIQAVFAALHLGGLKVNIGKTPRDYNTIICDELPKTETRMRIAVDFLHPDIMEGWNSHYREVMLKGPLELPQKNLLAAVISVFQRPENGSDVMRDWYGVYTAPNMTILREYKSDEEV